MSQITFKYLCECLLKCAEQLEVDVSTNIKDIDEYVTKNETIDVKLPLQKVKIYHYNEIIQILNTVKINIKKVVYHDSCIKKLDDTKTLSEDEMKYFSAKSRSNEDLTRIEPVKRRVSRRASTSNLYTLSAWEEYLKRKELELKLGEGSEETANVKKRNQHKSRKQRKLVSSTFNDILDNDNFIQNNDVIQEENEEDDDADNEKSDIVADKTLIKEENNEDWICEEEDANENSTPRIIDVLYKEREGT